MAKQAFAEVMQQYGNKILPAWDRRSRMVQRVLERLIPASGLTEQNWEVHVIDSDEKNAFVIPGGKVFVFTGILPIAKDEDGLATILGHEIAHNVAHHTSERLSRAFVLYAVATLLDFFIGVPGQLNQMLLQLVFFLPNGRAQETEADYIGLRK
jgi:metalloendopeptidase OMA1, mitochondrial